MGEVGQDQVAINAQLLAANDEFRTSLRAITEQLSQVHQRDRPNGPRPPARYQPDLESDADSTDDTQSREAERRNRAGNGQAGNKGSKVETIKTGGEAGTEKRRNRG